MPVPPIGKPPGDSPLRGSVSNPDKVERIGKPGEPRIEIRQSNIGVIKGPYFVLIDSQGNPKYESNVYLGGAEEDKEGFCRDGAERQLQSMKASGKIR